MITLQYTAPESEKNTWKSILARFLASCVTTLFRVVMVSLGIIVLWDSFLLRLFPNASLEPVSFGTAFIGALSILFIAGLVGEEFNREKSEQDADSYYDIVESLDRNNDVLEDILETLNTATVSCNVTVDNNGDVNVASNKITITPTETHGTVQILTEATNTTEADPKQVY